MITCPIDMPPKPWTAKTPKERIGLINAAKFRAYLIEGLEGRSLPVYDGYLNRMAAAKEVGFGRSAYAQNKHIAELVAWADRMLTAEPRKLPKAARKDLQAAREVERLRKRTLALKTDLDEANAQVSQLAYIEKMLAHGEVTLPW
jgi:hypothetical protein